MNRPAVGSRQVIQSDEQRTRLIRRPALLRRNVGLSNHYTCAQGIYRIRQRGDCQSTLGRSGPRQCLSRRLGHVRVTTGTCVRLANRMLTCSILTEATVSDDTKVSRHRQTSCQGQSTAMFSGFLARITISDSTASNPPPDIPIPKRVQQLVLTNVIEFF